MNKKHFELDFDGTVTEFNYPYIGVPNPQAIEVIKEILAAGHSIHLNTMRCEFNNETLNESYKYLATNGINLPNHFPRKKIHPPKWDVSTFETTEIIYIDDIAEGMPLINNMVDWGKVREDLKSTGLL